MNLRYSLVDNGDYSFIGKYCFYFVDTKINELYNLSVYELYSYILYR